MKNITLLGAFLCIFSYSFCQTTGFSDRDAWEAAAGTPCFTEDLEDFTIDTEFRSGPLQLNGFIIEQQGTDAFFRNEVDVLPLSFNDNNGTNNLSMYTNAAEGMDPGTSVVLTFDQPISAFYAEYVSGNSGEIVMEVYNTDMGMLDSYSIQNFNENRGVVIDDPNMPITSIVLKSTNLNPGPGGEGFGMDNIAMVCADITPAKPLPLMKKWQMLSMLLVVFGASFFIMRRFL